MRTFLLLLIGLSGTLPANASFVLHNKSEHLTKPYVILVSIDGYRYDYTDKFKTKNLRKFRDRGTSAEGLIPVFPSKTFPNHYSIATGLYASSHGIVANKFYAPDIDRTFRLSDRTTVEDGRFYGGLPLWSAAAKAGMVSAVYFWPGSEAEIAGYRPSRYYRYNRDTPDSVRVDQILEWLRLPESQRPHLLCLYFNRVDGAGHTYGTDSKELREAVAIVDEQIGRLIEGVKESGLAANIIIVSDHGMLDVRYDDPIYLDDIADFKGSDLIEYSQFALIYPENDAHRERIFSELTQNPKRFIVHRTSASAESLHFGNNPRIGRLFVEAEPPYILALRSKENDKTKRTASHGYDPEKSPEMNGIFYAQGPDIPKKMRIPAFRNIHIYPFVLRLLGLEIPPNIDGRLDVLSPLLEKKE